MEKIVLKRSGQRPLEFIGELLAKYDTSPNRAHSNYSGAAGRWSEVRIYRTKRGRFALQVVRYTQWQGERDMYEAEVFDTLEELLEVLERMSPRAVAEIAKALGVHEIT